jgi:hypothetical protein
VQTVSEESEAMTTVNMDEPLPAIALDEPELGNDSPRWELMLFRGDPGVKAHMKTMTLAHLVQVLAALTGEQLRAVATHELLEAPISDLAREELEPLRDSYDRQHEAEKQRDQEKARADRAEQERDIYRRGYEARGKLNVAYRTGGQPSGKTLDELNEVAQRLNKDV